MNHIKLLFFATIRDRAGTKSLEIDIPADMTILGLKDKLSTDYPNGRTEHTGLEVSLAGELGEFAGGKFLWNGNFAWSDQIYAFNRNVAAAAEDIFEGDQWFVAPTAPIGSRD